MRTLICLALLISILYPTIGNSSAAKCYEIYYLSLDSDFFLPPTREYIIKYGAPFATDSLVIAGMFDNLAKQKACEVQYCDYDSLRVLIKDKTDDKEAFITVDKAIILQNKKYRFDERYIDEILAVIIKGAKRKDIPVSKPEERIPITPETLNLKNRQGTP